MFAAVPYHFFQSHRQRHAPRKLGDRYIRDAAREFVAGKSHRQRRRRLANNRTQIFDSFFTTRRDSGGTGMGLAIVRAMLDAHGGAIRLVESEQGTAFELTIPVADELSA